jgi:hypothetical protein
MAETTTARFPCPACGKSYRWKPELAGRKVKCTCGHVMIAPKDTSGQYVADELIPLAGDEPAAHSVAGEQILAASTVGAPAIRPSSGPKPPNPKPKGSSKSGRCPSCSTALAPGAVLCVACGMNLKTGQKMQTAATASTTRSGVAIPYAGRAPEKPARGKKEEFENELGGSVTREIVIPAVLVVLGLAAQVALVSFQTGKFVSPLTVLPQLGVSLLINIVLSIGGIFLVSKLFDIAFGAIGPTILKVAAICLLTPAICDLIGILVAGNNGFGRMMFSSMLTLAVGATLFRALFDIDFSEALYCVIVIWIVNQWVLMILMGLIFSGSIDLF